MTTTLDDALYNVALRQRPRDNNGSTLRGRGRAADDVTTASWFSEGLAVRPVHCPRCGQLLQQEPAAVYCKYGCTRRWPIAGGSINEQLEWERQSGLLGTQMSNDLRSGRGLASAKVSPAVGELEDA